MAKTIIKILPIPFHSTMASHSLDEDRTRDVHLDRDYTFEHMLLPEPILRGLSEAGYRHPSLIQKKGIPIGRCGYGMSPISPLLSPLINTHPLFQTCSYSPSPVPVKRSSSA